MYQSGVKDEPNGHTGGHLFYKNGIASQESFIEERLLPTPIDRQECNLLYRFVANRYEKAITILTTNMAFSDWIELFHDQVIVAAILDRLLHHSTVINIRGNSFRLRGQQPKEQIQSPVSKG